MESNDALDFERKRSNVVPLHRALNTNKVSAIQLTGGRANGKALVDWVNANGGEASWVGAQAPYLLYDGTEMLLSGRSEQLAIKTAGKSMVAVVGDYIMKNESNIFYVLTEKEFLDEYQQTL